ncbi:hypothetical protein ACVWZL_003326 [Bradyrhizobium sp. GM2.4]
MFLTLFASARLVAVTLALIVLVYAFGPSILVVASFALLAFGTIRLAAKPRRPWMHTGLPVLMLLLAAPNFAFAATIDVGQALTGSLQDVINAVVTALITGLIGWVLILLKSKFNVDIEAQYRATLTAFLQRQASSLVAAGMVKVSGIKVEVSNEALAAAANTALAAIPDVLKFFGLTPDKIQTMIIDMLPKEPAVAQAQAIALDTANPATASAAASTAPAR